MNLNLFFMIKLLYVDFYKRKVALETLSHITNPRATDPTSQCSQNLNEHGQIDKKLQPNKIIIKASKP